MKNFYRITNEKMEVLATYMDSDIREKVHFRFAPCTNEEFVSHVLVRNGITEAQIEEVLNRDFDAVKETLEVLNYIKGYMICYNYVKKAKTRLPGRELALEYSAEGKEYRTYLDRWAHYDRLLKDLDTGFGVLSDFNKSFPEIDTVLKDGRLFYTWNGEIL